MARFLRYATIATLLLGPFVDDGDGKTAETGLTIARADVRLSKNGGDPAQKTEATTATHKENGYYAVPIDATDTNTFGRLRVMVLKTGALPVWDDFVVLPAKVFDSIISGTDNLESDAILWGGAALPTIPTAAQNRQEMDSNSTMLAAIAAMEVMPVGSVVWTYIVTRSDNHTPVPGVRVEAYYDAGCSLLAQIAITDSIGIATFRLVPGTYYILAIGGDDYEVPDADIEVVA